MNLKYEIVFGTGLDKNLNKVDMRPLHNILRLVAESFGGYSLTEPKGCYIMNDGTLVKENSLNLTILTKGDLTLEMQIRDVASKIKKDLNQESAIVIKTEIEGLFI